MLILLTSQQVRDEMQHVSYLETINGRFSSKEMLAPLKSAPFFHVYQYYGEVLKRYSMQMKKSESILANLMIIHCRFRGRLPEDSILTQGHRNRIVVTSVGCIADTNNNQTTIYSYLIPPKFKQIPSSRRKLAEN